MRNMDCRPFVSASLSGFCQSWNQNVAWRAANGAVAEYRFDPELPKPCVHPLTTPAGYVLSGFQMSDHIWHRGLWFAIKFINGVNFWEENPPFGRQQTLNQPICQFTDQQGLVLSSELDWRAPEGETMLREKRQLIFQTLDRLTAAIEWCAQLTAVRGLVLDRTPYTTWGGYGGLTFRASRMLHNVSFLLPDGQSVPGRAGQSHPWLLMQGQVDGAKDLWVSVALIDHPSNPRSPSPWYARCDQATFMNAAFLFHEKMELAEGQTLRFRYLFLWRDGTWRPEELAAVAERFRRD